MDLSPIDIITRSSAGGKQPTPNDLRRAATEFEALLLRQLTATMSSSGTEPEDGEDQLFGSDGGTSLAKQMFSEQMATTIANSGGIGLADVILKQLGGAPAKAPKGLSEARSAVTGIRNSAGVDLDSKAEYSAAPAFAGDPNDAAVISTFEEGARTDGIDESLSHMILNGRIVNTTRPRLAPNSPITMALAVPSVSGPAESVGYSLPVEGRLSSQFGNRFHPIDKQVKFHAGVDLAVPIGTPVKAAASGVVTFAGPSAGYGNLVIISHPDGRETRYGHLSRALVTVGQQVASGDEIALSGSTGKSTGPHVHFEIRENGRGVDPFKLLSKGLADTAER